MSKVLKDQVDLADRTKAHVVHYHKMTQDSVIKQMFPVQTSLKDALDLFYKSKDPGATSYGQVIYHEGAYVGDVWIYALDQVDNRAMISIMIFDKAAWSKGLGTYVLEIFTRKCIDKFALKTIGAFTYADNGGSRKALEKAGYKVIEAVEDSRPSLYLEFSTV